MTIIEHLSNQELVDEYHNCNNVAWSEEEHSRRELLKKEMLRRLNEPWRRIKEEQNDKNNNT